MEFPVHSLRIKWSWYRNITIDNRQLSVFLGNMGTEWFPQRIGCAVLWDIKIILCGSGWIWFFWSYRKQKQMMVAGCEGAIFVLTQPWPPVLIPFVVTPRWDCEACVCWLVECWETSHCQVQADPEHPQHWRCNWDNCTGWISAKEVS